MAPFRTARDRSNRSGRGQVEHNVLEGLPIHQWREMEIKVGTNQHERPVEEQDEFPEPPMPPLSQYLPEFTQQLLRAARAGRFHRIAPPDEEKESPDEEEIVKEKFIEKGFAVKKYVKVPRQLEEAEPEYLAKRRKGLPSQYTAQTGASGVPIAPVVMRETKVKKVEADGTVTVYKALVPEGQTVEGEIKGEDAAETPAPAVAAPGTVVEGVGVVNADGIVVAGDVQTPQRRRPPPPKKKSKKGPGRGKKKVKFVEGADASTQSTAATPAIAGDDSVKKETSVAPSDADTPMPDAPDGEDEEGEDGEDGSDDEEREDSEAPRMSATPASPSKTPLPQPQETAPVPENAAVEEPQIKSETAGRAGRDPSSSPELPLISHSRQNSLTKVPTLSSLEAGSAEFVPGATVSDAQSAAVPSATVLSPTAVPALSGAEASTSETLPDAPAGNSPQSAGQALVQSSVVVAEPSSANPVGGVSAASSVLPPIAPIAEPQSTIPSEHVTEAPAPVLPSLSTGPVSDIPPPAPIEPTPIKLSTSASLELEPLKPTPLEPPMIDSTAPAPIEPASIPPPAPIEPPTHVSPPAAPLEPSVSVEPPAPMEPNPTVQPPTADEVHFPDGDTDLYGSLERQLEESSASKP